MVRASALRGVPRSGRRDVRHMATILPRERLRATIARSGLSETELAKKAGYSSAAGLCRFLQARQGNKPIPVETIQRIAPLIRGRGDPPITMEELLASTDVKELPRPVTKAFEAVLDDGDGFLAVRYRIERGVFMRVGTERSWGASRIGVSREYPAASQFVAVMTEEYGAFGPAGSQLHCIELTAARSDRLINKFVVFGSSVEGGGLEEICLGTVQRIIDNEPRVTDVETGATLIGRIIAVVIGVYRRV